MSKKIRKSMTKLLAWGMALCMLLGTVSTQSLTAAAEDTSADPYTYTFYRKESGRWTWWEKSYYLFGITGSSFTDFASMLYLYGDDNDADDVAAYCADLGQSLTNKWKYKRINLEDCTYFDATRAAKLRSVFGEEADTKYRYYYWYDWRDEELANANADAKAQGYDVKALTYSQALTATQIAVWYCCNGGDMNNISENSIRDLVTFKWNSWDVFGDSEFIKMQTKVPTDARKDDVNGYGEKNIYQYALFLLNQPEKEIEQGKIVFSDKSFVETSASLVSASGSGSSAVYSVTVQFELATNLTSGLFLTASLAGDPTAAYTITPEGNNKYTVTFAGLSYDKIDTDDKRKISLAVSGTQEVDGVYFYEAAPNSNGDTRKASQNMVGPYTGTTTVSAETQVTFDIGSENVTLVKKDNMGKVVPGATFSLYAKKGSEPEFLVQSGLTTDANGKIVVDGLPAASAGYSYIFREDSAPAGYVKNTADCNVEAGDSVTFTNDLEMCGLTLKKTVEGVPSNEHFEFKVSLDLSTANLGGTEKVLKSLGYEAGAEEIEFTATVPSGCTSGTHSAPVVFRKTDNLYEATVYLKDGETMVIDDIPCNVKYTVVEVDSQGYAASGLTGHVDVALSGDTTVNAKNTWKTDKTSVTVTKVWEDMDNQGNTRPASVQVQLVADGNAYGSAVTLNEENNWTYTWNDLYAYTGTTPVNYTVAEVTVPEPYTSTIGEMTGDMESGYQYVITNKAPTAGVAISGTKTLDGDKTAEHPDFTFILKDSTGTEIDRQTVKGAGAFTFKEIQYAAAGDYTYTVTEVSGNADGWTYSDKTYTVVVSVGSTPDAEGNLPVTVTTTPGGSILFENTYTASCDVVLAVTKTLANKSLEAGRFSFRLKDASGNVLQTKSNAADGTVTFDAIEYTSDQVGQHVYKIEEVVPAQNPKAGITYDTREMTVTVDVKIERGDTVDILTATPSYTNNGIFRNSYAATGEVLLSASKSLSGRTLEDGQFSFQLKDASGNVLQTKTNAANGSITFDAISYDLSDVGSHKYTIVEVVPETKVLGYTYDTDAEEVTVEVSDNGDGTLTAAATYANGSAVFENSYAASGEIVLEAVKELKNKDLTEGMFHFTVKEGDATVAAGSNDADGKIIFTKIEYTQEDVGTHEYVITEDCGSVSGVLYSTEVEKATVTVTDNGDGTLTATPSYKGDQKFTNRYEAKGELTLEANKTLTGASLKGNDFVFVVKEGDVTVSTGTNTTDGKIIFETIEYDLDDVGTHTYKISEQIPDPKPDNGITYSDSIVTITVDINDNGDGTLNIETEYDNSAEFINAYDAKGDVILEVNKSLSGKALTGDLFAFELKDSEGNVLQTKKNAANGKVVFDKLTYDQTDIGKTYYYTISEVDDGVSGYTYDSHEVKVAVTVTDAGNGDLNVVAGYTGSKNFSNSYKANGSVILEAEKEVEGAALADGRFKFQLLDAEKQVLETVTNGADGKVVFGAMSYTQVDIDKEYTYYIKEVKESAAGYTYDEHMETVLVTITDGGAGTLTVTATYDADGAVFINKYRAKGSVSLEAAKSLSGRDLEADMFSFVLKDENGNVLQTKKNDASGNVAFDALNFTETDAGKTYTYTISEVDEEKAGYTYDTHTETVSVEVKDNGDGTLKVSKTYDADGAEFTNTYIASGSADLSVTKKLTGRVLADKQFSFQLKNDKGQVLQTKANDAQGKVVFDTLSYALKDLENESSKTYKYTISEVSDGKAGYDYDSHTVTVQVVVTDNGAGQLDTSVSYTGSREFTNDYDAKGSVVLEAAKSLSGRTLEDEQFTFVVKKGDATVATGKNDENGKITFSEIKYTEADAGQTYTYTISEADNGAEGYTYDTHKEIVTVTVTDNGDGTLTATPSYDSDGAFFTNGYDAKGSVTLEASKVLNGRVQEAGQFHFVVKKDDTVVAEGTNTTAGKVVFESIEYTEADAGKKYTYTICEVNDGAAGYTYDTHEETVTVTISDNGDGTLTAKAEYDTDGAVFSNSYAAAGDITLAGFKTLENKTLGDGWFSFTVKEGQKTVATGTNKADGTITFTEINYTLEDIGEHEYVITEDSGDVSGVTYSTASETVIVTVTDNGDGTLTATPDYEGTKTRAEFTNVYSATGSLILGAEKTLSGTTLTAGRFSFLVTEDGAKVAEGTNDATGNITFSDIEYDLDDVGTHTYEISEVVPSQNPYNGITYSEAVKNITVNVSDNGDGTLAVETDYRNDFVFENCYEADGSVVLQVTKMLNGRTLEDGQFSFVLRDEAGNTLQTKTNNQYGAVEFDAISYDQDDVNKTFKYTISEVDDSAAGYTYSDHVVNVEVTVRDSSAGSLIVEETYKDTAVFTNTYEAEGEVILEASKNLKGRVLAAEQFSFELRDEDDNLIETVKNSADGKITFTTLVYDEADAGKTFTYTIKEVVADAAGYTYDTHTETVTVEVTDNGDGTLTSTATYDDDGAVFTNIYDAKGSVMLDASKVLNGRALAGGQFSFKLKDADGNVLQTVSNDAEGKVTFAVIEYDEADAGKTFTYTINEVIRDAAGYIYDTHVETVTVEVADNGDGTLNATAVYDDDGTVFTNIYEAEGSVTLEASKVLDGRELENQQFSFELRDENNDLIEVVQNDADGKITFAAIAYDEADAGKTFVYTIKEVIRTAAGYTYDTHEETVAVVVTDDGDGTLTATADYDDDGAVFTNIYEAEGSVVLEANKNLRGRTLAAEQFSFELKDAEGNVLQTVSNDGTGNVIFAEIKYDEEDAGKTYTYTINEVIVTAAGYTFDIDVETVSVEIVDNGDGTLTVTADYDDDGAGFTNIYEAVGSVTLEASKVLNGRELANNQFAFELRDESSNMIETVKNDEDGKISFTAMEYDETDAGKTFTYTIKEVVVDAAGYTYDEHEETVIVEVTDNGDGTLTVIPTYDTDGAVFTNTYEAEGEVTLEASKILNGRVLAAEQFDFELKDAEGNVLQTVSNDAEGNVTFAAIEYDEADAGKTLTYTINEVAVDAAGYTYDTHIETVTVEVTDNGNGTLTAVKTYDDNGAVFTNIYAAEGSIMLEASKILEGRNLAGEQFAFELKDADGNVLQTGSNDAEGKVTFAAIEYDEVDAGKIFTYTISEIAVDAAGYTYDTHIETITVEVTDNGNGTLAAVATYDDSGAVFTNIYEAEGSVILNAEKILEGRIPEAEQFAFELKDVEGTVLQTVSNDADGRITFAAIEYDEADAGKTYIYAINEVLVDAAGYTYDEHVETIAVEVVDNGDGTLTATPAYDEDGASFVNVYKAEGSAVLSAKKILEGRVLEAEQFEFELRNEDGDLLQTKSNAEDGTITFDGISYNQDDVGKAFIYTVNEVVSTAAGYTYDEHTETVKVTIIDNGDGTLTAQIDCDEDGAVFTNIYEAEGSVTLEGFKTLVDSTLMADEFGFELLDAGGTVLQTKGNKLDGTIIFDAISYDQEDVGKTYTYFVREIIESREGYIYDKHVETITVTITDNGNGTLTATACYDADGASFINYYEEPDEDVILPDPQTPLGGMPDETPSESRLFLIEDEMIPLAGAPKTGDPFQLWQTIAALAGLNLAVVLLLEYRKRFN